MSKYGTISEIIDSLMAGFPMTRSSDRETGIIKEKAIARCPTEAAESQQPVGRYAGK